jgi:hypothetical protein
VISERFGRIGGYIDSYELTIFKYLTPVPLESQIPDVETLISNATRNRRRALHLHSHNSKLTPTAQTIQAIAEQQAIETFFFVYTKGTKTGNSNGISHLVEYEDAMLSSLKVFRSRTQ